MANRNLSPANRQRGNTHNPRSFPPVDTHLADRIAGQAAFDDVLAEAIRIGRDTLGADHPLVKTVIRELRAKEHKRARIFGNGADSLTALVCRGNQRFVREGAVARLLSGLLEEEPIREAHLPGFGERRVDMLFARHRLVVEENGTRHYYENGIEERDAALRQLCSELGLKLLVVEEEEPLTFEHLSDRLRELE